MAALKRIWSLWVGLWFFGFFLLIFPLHFVLLQFDTRLTHSLAHRLNTLWAYVVLAAALTWVRVHRKGRLPAGQGVVFIANHRSYFDIPISHVALPRTFRFIGKAELTKVPLFGYMYARLHIMVDRDSKQGRARSMQEADRRIKGGDNLFIFPEGTTKQPYDHQLGPVRDGAFKLALDNGLPLVPVAILRSNRALSNDGKFLMQPFVRVDVFIEPAIETKGLTEADLPKLRERSIQAIEQHLKTLTPLN